MIFEKNINIFLNQFMNMRINLLKRFDLSILWIKFIQLFKKFYLLENDGRSGKWILIKLNKDSIEKFSRNFDSIKSLIFILQ